MSAGSGGSSKAPVGSNATGLGIDHAGVERVKEAIKAYKKELEGLKLGASSQLITNAVRGAQSVSAVSKATSACNASIKRAIDVLSSYENVMQQIYASYKKEDTALSNNMSTSVSKSVKS